MNPVTGLYVLYVSTHFIHTYYMTQIILECNKAKDYKHNIQQTKPTLRRGLSKYHSTLVQVMVGSE